MMGNIQIRKAVTQQIINMLDNDILNEYGTESFVGWLEDGDVFRINGMAEEDVKKCMELAYLIEEELNNVCWKLENAI